MRATRTDLSWFSRSFLVASITVSSVWLPNTHHQSPEHCEQGHRSTKRAELHQHWAGQMPTCMHLRNESCTLLTQNSTVSNQTQHSTLSILALSPRHKIPPFPLCGAGEQKNSSTLCETTGPVLMPIQLPACFDMNFSVPSRNFWICARQRFSHQRPTAARRTQEWHAPQS